MAGINTLNSLKNFTGSPMNRIENYAFSNLWATMANEIPTSKEF